MPSFCRIQANEYLTGNTTIQRIKRSKSQTKDVPSTEERTIWTVPPHMVEKKNIWGKVIERKPMKGCFYGGLFLYNDNVEVTITDGVKNYLMGEFFERQALDIEKGEFLDEARWGGKW